MSTNPNVPPFEPGPPVPLEPAAYDPPLDSPAKAPPDVKAVKFTRAAALWSSLIIGLLVLIILLVFITQNTESVEIDLHRVALAVTARRADPAVRRVGQPADRAGRRGQDRPAPAGREEELQGGP